MGLKTFGLMGVDWEERVDLERLRRERLARITNALKASEMGALLCFDMNNIRYITATHIGTWAMDKLVRFSLLPQDDEPIIWDFGSAARHHQIYCPWLAERSRAGISTLRGATHPGSGLAEGLAKKIKTELDNAQARQRTARCRCHRIASLVCLAGARDQSRRRPAVDAPGQEDQNSGRDHTAQYGVHDGRFGLRGALPLYASWSSRERMRGVVSKVLYDLGSEHVEGVNAISGERCSPHPHVYTDRVLRPGDPAFFDILHSYNGYRTCYYRTFAIGSASPAMNDAYKRCRDYMDAAISIVKPGITTADVVKLWPKAEEFGFANEEAAFALQYGHGVGLSIWEKPIFSRLVSLDHPEVIEEGMVFALETYWPASDGWSAARLEEEVVVTKDGCEVITRFPSEKLLVAGTHYFHRRWSLADHAGSAVEL